MFRMLRNLAENMARSRATPATGRGHLVIRDPDALVYAVGDVHGCLDQLIALEDAILEDSRSHPGPVYVVMVGDYVDRGPDSAGVLDHLIRPAPGRFQRICLAGNHDATMLAFLRNPAGNLSWLSMGGEETLVSYGVMVPRNHSRRELRALKADMDQNIPSDHRLFLERLPLTVSFGEFVIVHAGLRPGVPLEAQSPVDLLWIRDDFLNASPESLPHVVVHGHTPVGEPVILEARIPVDTAAYSSGRLSAARLSLQGVAFLSSVPVQLAPAAEPAAARLPQEAVGAMVARVSLDDPVPAGLSQAAVPARAELPVHAHAEARLPPVEPLPDLRGGGAEPPRMPKSEPVPAPKPAPTVERVDPPPARPAEHRPTAAPPPAEKPADRAAAERKRKALDESVELDLAALALSPDETEDAQARSRAREAALAPLRPYELDVVPAAPARNQDLDSTVKITEEMIEQRIHALLNALNATKRARRAARPLEGTASGSTAPEPTGRPTGGSARAAGGTGSGPAGRRPRKRPRKKSAAASPGPDG